MLEKNKIESDILFLEKNSNFIIRKYFLFFKKNFFFKKFNKVIHTDIFEFNLYKYNKEILLFLNFLCKKKTIKKKIFFKNCKKIKSFFHEALEIIFSYLKANYLLISFFIYSLIIKLRIKNNNNKNYDFLFFNYLDHPDNLYKKKNKFWGEINHLIKNKKICWVHHTYINKKNILNFLKYKNLNKINILKKKNETHFLLEQLISLKSIFKIQLKFNYYFFQNLMNYFSIKKDEKNLDKLFFFITHRKIIIDSFFGKSFMRNMIFYENFSYIFKKNFAFKKIFYLKECLNWEKTLKQVLFENKFNFNNIYGYIHTPVRYWDLKFNYLENHLDHKLKENILLSSINCKKNLSIKNSKIKNIYLVESLRFKKNSKLIKPNNPKKNILLLGSYNKESTKKMINETIKCVKKYNIREKIDLKLHPLDNSFLDSSLINIQTRDIENLLQSNNYKHIIIESDSSIALQLLIDRYQFFIFRDNLNLNTSFLRNYKNIKFVSNLEEINKAFNSKLSKINLDNLLIDHKKLKLWRKHLK